MNLSLHFQCREEYEKHNYSVLRGGDRRQKSVFLQYIYIYIYTYTHIYRDHILPGFSRDSPDFMSFKELCVVVPKIRSGTPNFTGFSKS